MFEKFVYKQYITYKNIIYSINPILDSENSEHAIVEVSDSLKKSIDKKKNYLHVAFSWPFPKLLIP